MSVSKMTSKRHHVDDSDMSDEINDDGLKMGEREERGPTANGSPPRKPAAQNYPRKRVAVAVRFVNTKIPLSSLMLPTGKLIYVLV